MEYRNVELSELIEDIAAGPFGSNLKASTFTSEGFPIIDGANLKEVKLTDNITKFVTENKARSLSRSIAKRGDVVVTISGNVGQISYIPENSLYKEYLCSQRQFRVTFDKSKVYVPYLVYYFHTREGRSKILSFANQTGVPALSQPLKNFKKICIKLPSLETQRKSVKAVELLTDKIELNNQLNDYLAEIADSLFINTFGHLEENAVLSDIANIIMGQSPTGASYNNVGNGVVFYQGRGEFGWRFPTRRLFTTEPKRMAKAGDILMSVRAPVGDLNIAYEDCCIGRGLAVINCSYPSFCLYLMRSLCKKLNAYNSEGTVFGSINSKDLKNIEIALPNVEDIIGFEDKVVPIDNLIKFNEIENRNLSQLRDMLLSKLMSVKIHVGY